MVRLTAAQAEALTDAVLGELADDWPEDWPDHAEAFAVALKPSSTRSTARPGA